MSEAVADDAPVAAPSAYQDPELCLAQVYWIRSCFLVCGACQAQASTDLCDADRFDHTVLIVDLDADLTVD